MANAVTLTTNIVNGSTIVSNAVQNTTILSSISSGAIGPQGPTGSGINVLTSLGDMVYEDATPGVARLAGNTTSAKKFLTQTGTGSISAAPGWNAIIAGDLPDSTTSSKGIIELSNDLGGVADSPTTPTAVHLAGSETITGTKTISDAVPLQFGDSSTVIRSDINTFGSRHFILDGGNGNYNYIYSIGPLNMVANTAEDGSGRSAGSIDLGSDGTISLATSISSGNIELATSSYVKLQKQGVANAFLKMDNLTANRTYQFPNETGTISVTVIDGGSA